MSIVQRITSCLWFDDQAASWQIVPRILGDLMSDPDVEARGVARGVAR